MHRPARSSSLQPCIAAATLAATMILSSPAHGQLGIEGIFKEVTDVSFFSSCWSARAEIIRETERCPFGEHAFGFEVSFRVREISLQPSTDTRKRKLTSVTESHGADGSAKVDSVFAPGTVTEPTGWSILLELGLGYAQYGGFRSAVPDYDLRGYVREIPAVTLYGSLQTRKGPLKYVGAYAGLRTGLAQFRELQLITPVTTTSDTVAVFNASDAQTFQIGVVRGLYVEPHPSFSIYGEWSSMYRNFSSVKWTSASGTRIPARVPEGIDFSGSAFTLGVEVAIK